MRIPFRSGSRKQIRQLGEIDRHPPRLILGQPRGHKAAAWRYGALFLIRR